MPGGPSSWPQRRPSRSGWSFTSGRRRSSPTAPRCAPASGAPPPRSPPAAIIRAVRSLYRARRVYTLSYPGAGEWLLADERHVQRVGSGEPPHADRVVDLPGATIIPGFIDTHVHLTGTGLAFANEEVEQIRSAAELLALARRRASERRGILFIQGFDETRWDDARLPTLEELDAVTSR